ncbi:MAG: DUF3786 domain-containing protein [Thermoguttaceae bacterium]
MATERALERLRRQSETQLRWLGAVPEGGGWQLPVLNDHLTVRLSHPDVITSDGKEAGVAWRILALHYLGIATRPICRPPEVTFEDLASARSYAGVYRARVIQRLCATAGHRMETFRNAAVSVGGRPVAGGDAAYCFDVFPRIEVCLVWHSPDEEFPASATLLLPENIEAYLCLEDIIVMAERLVARLGGLPW